MAIFDIDGNYELRFRQDTGQSFSSRIAAIGDPDAIGLARTTRFPGTTLEVWQHERLVERLGRTPTVRERQAH